MPDTIDGHPYPLLTDENNPPKDIQELAESLADGNWASYTPTLTGLSGSAEASWTRSGKLVTVEFYITATGGASGVINLGKPVASFSTAARTLGTAVAIRSGSAASRLSMTVVHGGATAVFFLIDSLTTNAWASGTTPWSWSAGDTIGGTFQYRAA